MMKMEKMRPQDCHEVWMLQRECFSVPWSEDSIESMMNVPGYHHLIIRQGERLVGYIGMKMVLDEADITNVAVAPDCRRQGLGRQLLGGLLEKARQEHIVRIFLEVRASNEAAFSLYEQAGFQQVDVRKNYYEKPREDARLMMWEEAAQPCVR